MTQSFRASDEYLYKYVTDTADMTYLPTSSLARSIPLSTPSLPGYVGHPLLGIWNLNESIIPVRTPCMVIPARLSLPVIIPGLSIILVILHEFKLSLQDLWSE